MALDAVQRAVVVPPKEHSTMAVLYDIHQLTAP